MNPQDRVTINKLPTGIPGLDEIVGGGFPEFSFNIIAGSPGSGKTTLAHQFMFANATTERPALYFTVLGEPTIKMLRYQQQYTFFDSAKLSNSVRFINMSQVVLEKGLEAILEEITKEVEKAHPAIVVVDSFRTMLRKPQGGPSEMDLQSFIQRLALLLTSWQATTFLIGEYAEDEVRDNPVFAVADGLFWLSQVAEHNSVVRKLQVVKLRGQASVPGLHTFRISEAGLQAFSRTFGLTKHEEKSPNQRRLSIGIPELDRMLGGGIPKGDSVLITGSSGTGKSVLATQFIAEGIRLGEPGIAVVFEERPKAYAQRASTMGQDLETPQRDGKLEILYIRPLDLSVDETMHDILGAVKRIGAKRLVIDSLAGFEMALAPGFRADFRESLYRMIGALKGSGVTILSTVADSQLEKLKASKTAIELERMQAGAKAAEAGFNAAPDAIHEGFREADIAAATQSAFERAPLAAYMQRSYGFFYCMSGPNSASAAAAYARTRQRKVDANDLVMIHANTCGDGYWTDITRTWTAGNPTEKQIHMREAIMEARQAALDVIHPGKHAKEVDQAARSVLDKHGYGKEFKHALGHGVGFAAANAKGRPRIHPASPDVLEAGMTFNVEPAIYFDGYGGMRHCDVVAVTATGVQVLTEF